MEAPYKVIQLYRKEKISDEIDPRQVALEDYYDKYQGEIDLLQVDHIVQGYWDPRLITNLFTLSGRCITVMAPIGEISRQLEQARANWRLQQLIVFRN